MRIKNGKVGTICELRNRRRRSRNWPPRNPGISGDSALNGRNPATPSGWIYLTIRSAHTNNWWRTVARQVSHRPVGFGRQLVLSASAIKLVAYWGRPERSRSPCEILTYHGLRIGGFASNITLSDGLDAEETICCNTVVNRGGSGTGTRRI